ncbi:Retrovirus-related Pol polyprotein from transposon 297 [Acropora cervicornis]|uniref:Retrovirus-related Pol polyprotein from transposon 297 n=1 Tax=Acropora cervicornis TaxID=6130 RepID=A0AAD9UT96_ACRCE|nr:Retrovirus-related Pol polyprotein from transposon 297 [Acropora cervicornis]
MVAFLRLCKNRGLKLNTEQIRLRQKGVSFIGHVATDTGLRVDPAKVKAIVEMPAPTDKTGVQRLLGLAQYLRKPHQTPTGLTQKEVEWCWGKPQGIAFRQLKEAVDQHTSAANGQSVAYASRALSSAKTRYAQIEKELLAIVFACERFETYIYGRHVVHVDSGHKPLETIVLKPLHAAPQRLQRILLRLQKYNLELRYKKGCDMFLADTLNRAYLPEVNASELTQKLEGVDHKLLLPVDLMSLHEVVVQGMIVFKGHQLVVPAALRKEMMAATHNSHIGIEACIRRARESLYWPRMTVELKEYIQHCDVCLAHRNEQGKEPLAQHDFAATP